MTPPAHDRSPYLPLEELPLLLPLEVLGLEPRPLELLPLPLFVEVDCAV